jgi:hypothetical protein
MSKHTPKKQKIKNSLKMTETPPKKQKIENSEESDEDSSLQDWMKKINSGIRYGIGWEECIGNPGGHYRDTYTREEVMSILSISIHHSFGHVWRSREEPWAKETLKALNKLINFEQCMKQPNLPTPPPWKGLGPNEMTMDMLKPEEERSDAEDEDQKKPRAMK